MDLSQTRSEIVALLPRLRRFARALTGNASDADDAVQAGVERALKSLDQYQPGTKLDSWLFKVVKNAWIDEVRGRQRRERIFAPSEDGDTVGGAGAEAFEARRQLPLLPMSMANWMPKRRPLSRPPPRPIRWSQTPSPPIAACAPTCLPPSHPSPKSSCRTAWWQRPVPR
ncbi:MAG: RNA polymerase sigma factor [Asticcacaulis sp.]|nr:RNA polymerase sigma factor [Asticcacaulis sp.]